MKKLLFTLLACSACAFAADGFKPLFNGKNLDGWDGDPLLWKALDAPGVNSNDPLQQQRTAWLSRLRHYRARRPTWSQLKDARPPWSNRQER